MKRAPYRYGQAVRAEILRRLAAGERLRAICGEGAGRRLARGGLRL